MSNIGSYEERLQSFDWSIAERELGYRAGDVINIGYHCSDRICQLGQGGKPALLWEDHQGHEKRFTFDDLRVLSNTIAAFLVRLGVEPGERVCLFMDRVPELYIGFLGVLKMGGIVQPLFSAFREDSLVTRLKDAGTCVVITQRKHLPVVRRTREQLPSLRQIVVVDSEGAQLKAGEVAFDLAGEPRVEAFDVFPSTAETPSVLHYTSGTTGQPKGAQHVHYSLISQYLTTKWVLDLQADDIYWCNADPGWVTGTSYGIIGPWANGATQAVLDAGFSAPRWYAFLQKYRVTVWYSAPTAIRLLMREGTELVRGYDLSALRHLASVGEPLNAEAVLWSKEAFGRPFHDTYWQTETGCIVVTNLPGMPIKPGSMGKPFPGITAAVVDLKTSEPLDQPGAVGLIGLRPGWPSMIRGYWNNPVGYAGKFKNGWYLTGDRASKDNDGYFWFVGRDDDVINTGGHLVGPFEIESALLEHPAVAESAAVATPDPTNMEVVKAFVTLKKGHEGSDDLELEIMNFIRKRLSPLAMPQKIQFVAGLPKTRSGKIMRRVLRAQEFGEPVGDISTLMDE
ncbi:MAG TPA: acetate--CoA ligase [Thermoanaerobaculales bacterium]|nr:acetate--CoA ligase [Thermoanaerobaculales bacterium]HPA82098.1 acetate--CoA ligase [Thermoanaerobaculales bacterium]HQL29676.1 acetate--CoA ligase [Thermoanaerobaculales bacterium]HQN95410.1 acetate--CoA ligase [Thermoanaerobaculales bacterium]HQP43619.1 acetate--CoA ligase [Thermoanaerobaculales bacterium]